MILNKAKKGKLRKNNHLPVLVFFSLMMCFTFVLLLICWSMICREKNNQRKRNGCRVFFFSISLYMLNCYLYVQIYSLNVLGSNLDFFFLGP